jgi:U3 small nucleolar RNA-associated protein 21
VSSPAVSISLSSNSEWLATAHLDELGIYTWANRALFTHVPLVPVLTETSVITPLPLPSAGTDNSTEDESIAAPTAAAAPDTGLMVHADLDLASVPAAAALGHDEREKDHLAVLSLLPDSRWRNLLHLDIIRKKNRPIAPLRRLEKAPFFLPSSSALLELMTGLPPQSEVAGRSAARSGSRASLEGGVLSVRLLQLAQHLVQSGSTQSDDEELILDEAAKSPKSTHSTLATLPLASCESLLSVVREWGAARIEFEIESLAATLDEHRESVNQTSNALRLAIKWLTTLLLNQHNYEFVSALLAILLRIHLKSLRHSKDRCLLDELECSTSQAPYGSWIRFRSLLSDCSCVTQHLLSSDF